MVIRLTPKPSATSQSRRLRPRTRGRATTRNTTAEVTRRSQTIAVGGTTGNRSLAIAAPNWTETMPPITSQTAGMRPSPPPRASRLTTAFLTVLAGGKALPARPARPGSGRAIIDARRRLAELAGRRLRWTLAEALDDAAELHRWGVRSRRTRSAGEGEGML